MIGSSTTSDIEDFLKRADKYVQRNPLKHVVLILGNTRSGKSTFTQFISGKGDNLISQQEKEDIDVFTITDKNNKINQDFSTSVTFPELAVDSKTDVAYYDCPGFSDSTSITHKISSIYFIKKIIDSAETIKLVFTVDYTLFETDFLLILRHLFDTISDIENFKDSIALVVTKVDNKKRKQERIEKNTTNPCIKEIENEGLVSNMNLINEIASSLKNIKNNFLSSSPSDNQEFSENAIKFIDILLQKKNEKFTKIGLFRRPNRLGQVNKITLLQCDKKKLKKILQNNIQYTTPTVFQNQVFDLVEQINNAISSSIVNIGKEIQKDYYLQEEQSYDIYELYKKLKIAYNTLSEVKTITATFVKPEDLIEQMIKNIVNLKITLSNQNFLNIIDYTHFLKFINTGRSQMSIKPMEWAKGLTYVVKYLDDSQKWYKFLINLHNALSTYDIQQNISHYTKITNGFKKQTNTIKKYLRQFIKQVIQKDSENEFSNIENIEIDESKLKNLNKLLDSSLNESIKAYENDTHNLLIMGEYVKLSEATKHANYSDAKSIEILALNKVFIDDDLNKTITLSIVAPLWEIVGTHHIILDGKPGEAHEVAKAKNGIGVDGYNDGYNGKSGKPGGSAGHFLGIGDTFINSRFLNISANGGKGGPGQDGGDGFPGQDGTDPPVLEHKPTPCGYVNGNHNVLREQCEGAKTLIAVAFTGVSVSCDYILSGKKRGTPGGDAGHGGRPGYGGYAGNIIISALSNYTEILKSNNTGATGTEGIGGTGGRSGKSGKIIKTSCTHHILKGDKWTNIEVISDNTERQGNNGKSGFYAEDLKKTESVPFRNPSYTINKFKSYLRENLSNNIKESALREFLDLFENRKEVIDLYDTFGLINELQGLENQFFKMHKNLPFLPFYKSLLRRITQYADKSLSHISSKDTEENRKVLSYLYTATLSKICSLNNNGMDNLVVNLKEYLNLRIDDINELRELNKASTINNFKKKYQQEIQAKQDEAKQFIDIQITPEINKLMNQMNDKLQSLIDETIALQEREKDKRKKLIQRQKQLENALMITKILSVVKVASQFLSFTGPIGTAVSAAVDTGNSIISDSLVLDDSNADINEVAELPSALEADLKKISEQFKDKQKVFKEQLKDVHKALEKIPDDESNNIQIIKVKVNQAINVLDGEIKNEFSFKLESVDKIQTMRKDVTELLENGKKAMEKKDSMSDKIQLIEHLQNLVSIADLSINVYKKIRGRKNEINTLSKTIEKADENINNLMQYEKVIYNIIFPICNSLRNNVKTISDNLQKQSHVALDISKWKIQSTIKDVKIQLRKMIKGFGIEEDFMHCMDKLEEGMTIMINLYNRIEDYNDKAELAAYIADINSDKALGITVKNEELNEAVDNLKLVIQSNLVLEKYELAMNAFRLSTFPLADLYLKEFNLPESLKSNVTETLISNAKSTIEKIIKTIKKHHATVPTHEQHMWKDRVFTSLRKQSSPLYVWKHSTNKHVISKLLEGEEITVKADITQGTEKNAVKFNEIRIRLKSANNSIQQRLDDDLKGVLVNLTHLGNSYYRCDNAVYSIASDKLSLPYHYCTNDCEDPLEKNVAREKIKFNDAILSPYAMWQIKLTNDIKEFKPLSKYKKFEIDLELEGLVQYINKGTVDCNNLEKYYTLDNTISQSTNIDYFVEPHSDQVVSTDTSHNQQDHARSRRSVYSVNEHTTIQYIENNLLSMASSASNNIESSFLNNLINVIGTKLISFKNSNLLNQITKWFINKESTTGQEIFDTLNQTAVIIQKLQPLNIQSLYLYLPENSERLSRFIDYKESTFNNNVINDSLLYNHGSLILLDLANRLKSGIKYKNTAITVTNDLNLDFAQNLAYRHHIPKNKVYA